jgi:exodeoxyribonuclease VII small subunit
MEEKISHAREKSFETKLAELEQIAQKLNQGNIPLEHSLEEFERAIRLSKDCQQILQKAQQKVKILLQDENQNWQAETDYNKTS